mmetsp:Transcript_3257/g.6127  ORF Transcript_3257/g.6127 Transcript_3257/m.6127 type:complete len:93 (+) Transcript_3257:464-742(+)
MLRSSVCQALEKIQTSSYQRRTLKWVRFFDGDEIRGSTELSNPLDCLRNQFRVLTPAKASLDSSTVPVFGWRFLVHIGGKRRGGERVKTVIR